MSRWTEASRSNLAHDPGDAAGPPAEVRQLIREASDVANGDSLLTVAVLWERLIWDAEITAERGVFMRWLARQSASDRPVQVVSDEPLDRSA
jgi:hypothetical protein